MPASFSDKMAAGLPFVRQLEDSVAYKFLFLLSLFIQEVKLMFVITLPENLTLSQILKIPTIF